MTHGSLFSGIGGFDLAAEWMGWENLFHCEWNPFGQKVLHHYWPNAEQFTDITKTDFTKYANRIDILTGGFPCQPYSHAGKRLGKDDDRHLWPEMLRAIREIQPKWVVGENVSGLISWNGGMVFDEVQTDLEVEGYEVQPFVLPACAVNAPHRRDRVWFVAYRSGLRQHTGRPEQSLSGNCTNGKEGLIANSNKCTARPSRTSGSIESNRSNNHDEPEQWGKQAEQHNRPHEFLRATTNSNGSRSKKSKQQQPNLSSKSSRGNAETTPNPDGIGSDRTQKHENGSENSGNGQQPNDIDNDGQIWRVVTNASSSRPQTDNALRKPKGKVNASGVNGENILATNSDSNGHQLRGFEQDRPAQNESEGNEQQRQRVWNDNRGVSQQRDATDTGNQGLQRGKVNGSTARIGQERNEQLAGYVPPNWQNFPTQPPVCSRNDGLSPELVGITVPKHRNESIKAYGNAIVPQVALQIFKAIDAMNNV